MGQNKGLSFVPIGPSRALAIGVTEVRSGSYILATRFVIVLTYTTLQPSIRTGWELHIILVSPSIVGIYPWVLVILGSVESRELSRGPSSAHLR